MNNQCSFVLHLFVWTEYCKDLPTYLQYCKDVVFAGIEPSLEDFEEERAIDRLWDFYQKHKVTYDIIPSSILTWTVKLICTDL